MVTKTTTSYIRDGDGDKYERTRFTRYTVTGEERVCRLDYNFNAVVLTVEDCLWHERVIDDRREIVMTAEDALAMAIQLLSHADEVMHLNAE
tara:strand:- start:54 stop:329 length:276 start_codon:yes stop_codon:yes gene_type:complete